MDIEPYLKAPDGILLFDKTEMIIYAVIAVLLFVASVVISAAKQAANSLLPIDIKQCENDKRRNFRRVFELMQKSEKLTATMQVTHVFVNVSFVIFVFLVFASKNIFVIAITMITIVSTLVMA